MNPRLRRHGFFAALMLLFVLFTAILILSTPSENVNQEQYLLHRLAEMKERLHYAEMLNQERRKDILILKQKYTMAVNNMGTIGSGNSSSLWSSRDYLSNVTNSGELQLPSIYNYLPHLLGSPTALQPAYRLARGRTGVFVVFGIPTVKRDIQSYLMTTLQNLIENMSTQEREDAVIVVFIAETDEAYIQTQAKEIHKQFREHVDSGLLEVIAPSVAFYPDFNSLRQTLGDTMDRVKWRTKQNLDFAFLMMYAQPKGMFYVQLEDDILTKPGYLSTMKKFALDKTSSKQDWFILDFCQLGFIGKMFKCAQLPMLVQFFIMFHNDKPVDWLLDHLIQTRVCSLDKDTEEAIKVCWDAFKFLTEELTESSEH